jgi:hypothetical protein
MKRTDKEKESLLAEFIGAVIWCIIALVFTVFVVMKDDIRVYWSTSKNECVKILVNGKESSCTELSNYPKHEKVWIK